MLQPSAPFRGTGLCAALHRITHTEYGIHIEMAFCDSCLTFPKAWEIQMGRCLSGTGLGLAWFLGRLPALREQEKLNQNPFGGLGHVRPVDAEVQSLAAAVTPGQSELFWQTPLVAEAVCVPMLSVQQCPQHRWDVLEGSFTGCWCRNGRSRTLDAMAPVAGQCQVLGTCSLGFSLHFVHQT